MEAKHLGSVLFFARISSELISICLGPFNNASYSSL